jgi:hypothetical protein
MDSIRQLADFWDKHDLTDFEPELEEVSEPVFSARDSINLQLKPNESKKIQRIAKAKGVPQAELVRQWVLKELERHARTRRAAI